MSIPSIVADQDHLTSAYEVNEHGRIKNPGKFEGEPLYVPYFHQFCGEGEILTTMENGVGIYQEQFQIDEDDVKRFPELKGNQAIIIREDEQGFVGHELVEAAPVIYCASVFLVDKAYGGPEEGGWWYETGETVFEADKPLPRFTLDREEAIKWTNEMQKELDATVNVGRPSIGSVLSQGQYQAMVTEGMPEGFPSSKPYYE